jgi:hypothetical protein
MSTAFKSERSQGTLIGFPQREPVQMDADLKAFLDEVIIPTLIREALKEMQAENSVESETRGMKECAQNFGIAEATR